MSYQWGPQGPAFEVAGIYRSENLALLVRAALLLVLALLVLLPVLMDVSFPRWFPTRLLRLPQEGQGLHGALGLLLLALAAIDLLRLSRQRALRLLPGQPGPLVPVLRSANTPNPEAEPLATLLGGGTVAPPSNATHWPLLARLSPTLLAAPPALREWMAQRLVHLTWIAGLALALLVTRALMPPPGVAVMGALCVGMAAFVLLRARQAARAAPRPRAVALQLGLTLLAGLAASRAPQALTAPLAAAGLAEGAALMLAALLLTELVALAAGLVVAERPLSTGPAPAPCSVAIAADPERVQQELERELHRYWSEGVPNRRYLWQSNQVEHRSTGAGFEMSSLEESQPLPAATAAPVGSGGVRRPWLLGLLGLGLAFTLIGGLLWGVVVWSQLQRAPQPWRMGSAAVLFFFAGGYALRVAHLLWSRVEARSLLLRLQCSSAGASTVQLRWEVARARSAFYAASEHVPGSRVLLELASDEDAARRSAQQVKRYAEKINTAEARDSRPPSPAPSPAPAAPAAPAGRRFCVDCGESIPAAARFCPRCGERQRGV